MLLEIQFIAWHDLAHIYYCTYYILYPSKVDLTEPHLQTNSHENLADFCLSWDSLQEIDSSWTLLFQRNAATIQSRYTLSFVRCLRERSYALTHRIWVGWREDSLLNKWLLSHKRKQPLMSLSSQLARSMSSSKPVLRQIFNISSAFAFLYLLLCGFDCNASVSQSDSRIFHTVWSLEL